jgi:hypothetical protein
VLTKCQSQGGSLPSGCLLTDSQRTYPLYATACCLARFCAAAFFCLG